MSVANPRRVSLADAVRREFERTHPGGRGALLCLSCRLHKDRAGFRETPWHGRAASCKTCEGDQWSKHLSERTFWELVQAREKLRAYQRYARFLRLRDLIRDVPSSADVVRAAESPVMDAYTRHVERWARVLTWAATKTTEEK
jgi:hypothetical protein